MKMIIALLALVIVIPALHAADARLKCQGLESYEVLQHVDAGRITGTIRLQSTNFQATFSMGKGVERDVPLEGRDGLQAVRTEQYGNRRIAYAADTTTTPPTLRASVAPGADDTIPFVNVATPWAAKWTLNEFLFVAKTFAADKCEIIP